MEEKTRGVVSSGWLGPESTSDPPNKRRIGRAMAVSLFIHGLVLATVLILRSMPQVETAPVPKEEIKANIIFLKDPGPGGGGGGSPAPAPPKPMEIPKHKTPDPVPVLAPPVIKPPLLIPVLNVTIETSAAQVLQMSGANSISLGTVVGGGSGGGIGKGKGDGVGEGIGGGFGDGAYASGNGVTDPVVIKQVKPAYTPEAMRSKITGDVLLEAIVMPDGTVGKIRVIKSLDTKYGLDEEAIKATKQWLFQPGTRLGQKVAVIIKIEMSFRLH